MTLYSLYLLPQAQKQGIGRQSFDFVSHYCVSHGFSELFCHCQPDNRNAMDFYQHMGGCIIKLDEENAERWQNSVVFRFKCRFIKGASPQTMHSEKSKA